MALLAAGLDPPLPPIIGEARASDGDSIRLGETRIRLLGIDAPELSQQCDTETGASWPCGQIARDRMAALLALGPLDCRPDGKDQYGRTLANCTVTGADIGAIMVGEGLAVSSGAYWSQEATARAARRGIWSGPFDTPRQWRDDNARSSHAFGWLWGFLR